MGAMQMDAWPVMRMGILRAGRRDDPLIPDPHPIASAPMQTCLTTLATLLTIFVSMPEGPQEGPDANYACTTSGIRGRSLHPRRA